MTNIQVFSNPEFGKVEVAIINGKKHVTATECARVLGYAKPDDAIRRHCRYPVKHGGVSLTTNQYGKTTEQAVEKTFIPIGDLCRLIARSNLPEAEKFERWIFDEVLPSVVSTGMYIAPSVIHRLQYENTLLLEENDRLRQQVKGLVNGLGSFHIRDVALHMQKNGIGDGNPNKAVQMLIDNGLLQKDTSVKKGGWYRPFLKDIRAGYFDHELTNNGEPVLVWQSQITVTAKGLAWIVDTLLSLKSRRWERDRPMIGYSREIQRRMAMLSPEVGGMITVADELGNDVSFEMAKEVSV